MCSPSFFSLKLSNFLYFIYNLKDFKNCIFKSIDNKKILDNRKKSRILSKHILEAKLIFKAVILYSKTSYNSVVT